MKKFNVFDPVLTRMHSTDTWSADFYDRPHISDERHWTTTGCLIEDTDILPYNEETKHLHNTVGEFVKWEPKKGEPILVRDHDDDEWFLRIFLGMCNGHFICTSECEVVRYTYAWRQAKPYTNPFKE